MTERQKFLAIRLLAEDVYEIAIRSELEAHWPLFEARARPIMVEMLCAPAGRHDANTG